MAVHRQAAGDPQAAVPGPGFQDEVRPDIFGPVLHRSEPLARAGCAAIAAIESLAVVKDAENDGIIPPDQGNLDPEGSAVLQGLFNASRAILRNTHFRAFPMSVWEFVTWATTRTFPCSSSPCTTKPCMRSGPSGPEPAAT